MTNYADVRDWNHLQSEFCDLMATSILSWSILYSDVMVYFQSSAYNLLRTFTLDLDRVDDRSLNSSVIPNLLYSDPFLRDISRSCLVLESRSLPISDWRSVICLREGRQAAFSLSQASRQALSSPLRSEIFFSHYSICWSEVKSWSSF